MTQNERDPHTSRINAVSSCEPVGMIKVDWNDGRISRIDLTPLIYKYKALKPLRGRKGKEKLLDVGVGDWGWSVVWDETIEISAETIAQLESEQQHIPMTAAEFRAALELLGFTQPDAANTLGISNRSVSNYATGAQPIPQTVALALKHLVNTARTSKYATDLTEVYPVSIRDELYAGLKKSGWEILPQLRSLVEEMGAARERIAHQDVDSSVRLFLSDCIEDIRRLATTKYNYCPSKHEISTLVATRYGRESGQLMFLLLDTHQRCLSSAEIIDMPAPDKKELKV